MAKFGVILADYPWDYWTYGAMGRKRSPDVHYNVMPQAWGNELPVQEIAADDCVLLFWATWPKMPEAMEMIKAWDFTFKTGFPWLKLSKDLLPRMGTGYHARACTEPLLIATKGSPRSPEPFERLEGVLFSKLGAHSAKPDEIYMRAELYDGPYLELFARPDGGLFPLKPGWVQCGNELTGRSIECDLLDLAAGRPLPILPHLRSLGEQSATPTPTPAAEQPLTLF